MKAGQYELTTDNYKTDLIFKAFLCNSNLQFYANTKL